MSFIQGINRAMISLAQGFNRTTMPLSQYVEAAATYILCKMSVLLGRNNIKYLCHAFTCRGLAPWVRACRNIAAAVMAISLAIRTFIYVSSCAASCESAADIYRFGSALAAIDLLSTKHLEKFLVWILALPATTILGSLWLSNFESYEMHHYGRHVTSRNRSILNRQRLTLEEVITRANEDLEEDIEAIELGNLDTVVGSLL